MLVLAPYLGYLASLMLIIALLVTNDIKFRWFNTAGNVAFIIYAIVLHALPVLLTNTILLGINLFHLVRIYRHQENFDLIEFSGEEKLATKFTSFYRQDIASYFPAFEQEGLKGRLNFVVLRDLVIANMFSATLRENGDAEIFLNYTLKKYRDYKVGRFIFEKEKKFLQSKGIKRIVYYNVPNKNHAAFLEVMGFEKTVISEGQNIYIKPL
ncbi:MAG: YgjV family protein [Ferruginibacter sp.]